MDWPEGLDVLHLEALHCAWTICEGHSQHPRGTARFFKCLWCRHISHLGNLQHQGTRQLKIAPTCSYEEQNTVNLTIFNAELSQLDREISEKLDLNAQMLKCNTTYTSKIFQRKRQGYMSNVILYSRVATLAVSSLANFIVVMGINRANIFI